MAVVREERLKDIVNANIFEVFLQENLLALNQKEWTDVEEYCKVSS